MILWPEFRSAWVLLAVIAAAFAIDAVVFWNGFLLSVEGGLFVIIFAMVMVTIYRAAEEDRDTKIERSELRSILGSIDEGLSSTTTVSGRSFSTPPPSAFSS